MGAYNLVKNTTLLIDLPSDYSDNGWTISGGIATHQGCNAGYISLIETGLLPATQYIISYEVSNYSSGLVKAVIGGVSGANRTASGVYTETITTGGDGTLKFYSDGNLSVDYLDIYTYAESLIDNSLTLAFNENANMFVTYYSWKPEFMIKFIDGFFTAKNGQIWEHNVNPIRNNFYGVQYKSQISFYVNMTPSQVKDFFTIRVQSNRVWSSPNKGDIYILPTEGKSEGMSSRLKKGRFQRYGTDYFADFLRNMDDPRFIDELEALMTGSELQGKVMKITIENDDTIEVKLFAVDVDMASHSLTR